MYGRSIGRCRRCRGCRWKEDDENDDYHLLRAYDKCPAVVVAMNNDVVEQCSQLGAWMMHMFFKKDDDGDDGWRYGRRELRSSANRFYDCNDCHVHT